MMSSSINWSTILPWLGLPFGGGIVWLIIRFIWGGVHGKGIGIFIKGYLKSHLDR